MKSVSQSPRFPWNGNVSQSLIWTNCFYSVTQAIPGTREDEKLTASSHNWFPSFYFTPSKWTLININWHVHTHCTGWLWNAVWNKSTGWLRLIKPRKDTPSVEIVRVKLGNCPFSAKTLNWLGKDLCLMICTGAHNLVSSEENMQKNK